MANGGNRQPYSPVGAGPQANTGWQIALQGVSGYDSGDLKDYKSPAEVLESVPLAHPLGFWKLVEIAFQECAEAIRTGTSKKGIEFYEKLVAHTLDLWELVFLAQAQAEGKDGGVFFYYPAITFASIPDDTTPPDAGNHLQAQVDKDGTVRFTDPQNPGLKVTNHTFYNTGSGAFNTGNNMIDTALGQVSAIDPVLSQFHNVTFFLLGGKVIGCTSPYTVLVPNPTVVIQGWGKVFGTSPRPKALLDRELFASKKWVFAGFRTPEFVAYLLWLYQNGRLAGFKAVHDYVGAIANTWIPNNSSTTQVQQLIQVLQQWTGNPKTAAYSALLGALQGLNLDDGKITPVAGVGATALGHQNIFYQYRGTLLTS